MDKLFTDLSKLFSYGPKCTIDNIVFRFHYKITMVMLIAFSIAVTASQFIGNPIECMSKDDIPEALLKTFCWVSTTFSIKSAWKKEIGKEIPYPGIQKAVPGEDRVYHAYYQWVCLVLFLQGMFFFLPRYLWKNIEKHKIRDLRMDLHSPVVKPKDQEEQTTLIADYLFDNFDQHRFYAAMYALCETLNFVNVIVQIFIMDKFLGGEFTTYGTEVLKFTEWDYSVRYDPMIKVFPRMSKCTFYKYGSSGDVQKHDAMCLISINILNEKIYIFLWFWFLMLAIITGLTLIYRIGTIFNDDIRFYVLRYNCPLPKKPKKDKDGRDENRDTKDDSKEDDSPKSGKGEKGSEYVRLDSEISDTSKNGYEKLQLVRIAPGKRDGDDKKKKTDFEEVLGKCRYGDWLILFLLCNNMASGNFKIMLHKLAEKIRSAAKTN